MFLRIRQNLFGGWLRLGRWFPPAALQRVRDAVAAGEMRHLGEVCFAVESRLALAEVLRGGGVRRRAEHVFAQLRVWDTAHNSGVLIYVLLSERKVEIVADRGIAARVGQEEWERICAGLAARFARGEPEAGVMDAIAAVHALLERHFPAGGAVNPNERPDDPVVL